MDCALISTVYARRVTSRVHEKFVSFLITEESYSAEIFGVGLDHRYVYGFLEFLKSGPSASLRAPRKNLAP